MRLSASIAICVLALVFSLHCGGDGYGGGSAGKPQSPSPRAPATGVNVCRPNPAPASNSTNAAEFFFRQLDSPKAGDSVRSPLRVSGRANPFEGAFSVTLFDAAGIQVATRNFMKDNGVAAFSAEVPFSVTTATPACVWVYESSGRDGSPTNVTQVAVTLSP